MKILLLTFISFIAITSILSGILMISFPENGGVLNIPHELLQSTPFSSFRIPGMLLAMLVGGTNLLAIFYYFENDKKCYQWAMAGGLTISGWIIIQMMMISAISWLQFFYLGIGILITLISRQLHGKWLA